jgi:transposase
MGHRRYTREFKDEACKLGSDPLTGPLNAAKRLGIPQMTLRSWMKQRGLLDPRISKQMPESDDPKMLKEQIRQLQKQLAESETDKEILKKAVAFFARESN